MNKHSTIRPENGSESISAITESSSENVFEMTADHTTIERVHGCCEAHVSENEVAYSEAYQALISAAEPSFGLLMGAAPSMVAGAGLH